MKLAGKPGGPMAIAPRLDQSTTNRDFWWVSDYADLDLDCERDWSLAIEIFEDRIIGRFLEPVARLREYPHAGFAIIAIDSLLIEVLEQFRTGTERTPDGHGRNYFVNFLTSTRLGESFDAEKAIKFYKQFRSGILHQGETLSDSLIRSEESNVVSNSPHGDGIIIDRNKFHDQLVEAFHDYVALLRDSSQVNVRAKFRVRMNAICRISTLYFAYGANMDITKMKARCSQAREHFTGRLLNHRLVFDKVSRDGTGKADVLGKREFQETFPREAHRANQAVVWGVLYDVPHNQLDELLDRYEQGYEIQPKAVELQDGSTVVARVCVANAGERDSSRRPDCNYLNDILGAARVAGFPDEYVTFLDAFPRA